jgi:type IV pilus assembly protein PilC
MPLFKWNGFNKTGVYVCGQEKASSPTDLLNIISRKEYTLISFSVVAPRQLRRECKKTGPILFSHLATLLLSQIRLTNALRVIAELVAKKRSSVIIEDLAYCVDSGLSLSEALSYYPAYFDTLSIVLVQVGEHSGNLGSACHMMNVYNNERELFVKKIKEALVGPVITLLFFLLTLLFLFFFIVPYFASLLQISGKAIPPLTAILIQVSQFFFKPFFWIILAGFFLFICAVNSVARSSRFSFREIVLQRIPFVHTIRKDMSLAVFLQALFLLLSQGVPLLQALKIARETVSLDFLKNLINQWITKVAEGKDFSHAIRSSGKIDLAELEAFIAIGESSGGLIIMIERAAELYKEKALRSARFISYFLQPFLLLILGLMIGAVIFALYMPLLSLGDIF